MWVVAIILHSTGFKPALLFLLVHGEFFFSLKKCLFYCRWAICCILANSRLRPDFPSPSGGVAPWAPPLGAFGAPVRVPAVHIWATAAFVGGERKEKEKLECHGRPSRGVGLAYAAFGGDKFFFFGAPPAPQMVLKTWPLPWGFQICAWFWNRTAGKWFL